MKSTEQKMFKSVVRNFGGGSENVAYHITLLTLFLTLFLRSTSEETGCSESFIDWFWSLSDEIYRTEKYSDQLSEQNGSSVLAYLGDHLWQRSLFMSLMTYFTWSNAFWESKTTLPLPSSKQNVPNSEETSCLLTISSLRVRFWSACSAVVPMHFDMAPQPWN